MWSEVKSRKLIKFQRKWLNQKFNVVKRTKIQLFKLLLRSVLHKLNCHLWNVKQMKHNKKFKEIFRNQHKVSHFPLNNKKQISPDGILSAI